MTHKFAVGDVVRVVKRVESEDDWNNVWMNNMDALAGKESAVVSTDNQLGVELSNWYYYPPSSLELVKSHQAVTEVN